MPWGPTLELDPTLGSGPSVTGPSFPQSTLYFNLCNSIRREQLWVKFLSVGCEHPPSFAAGGGQNKFSLPTVRHFI